MGNNTNASAIKIETIQPQTNGLPKISGIFSASENSACQDRVIEKNIHEKYRRVVDNAVMTVKYLMHDAILKAMDVVVKPRIEMVVRSITKS